MLQVVYTTEQFKNTVQKLFESSKFKHKPYNTLNIQYTKFSRKFEKLSEIIDDANGLILEFNDKHIRKTIMLYLSAKFIGIPVLLANTNIPNNKTAKLLAKTLKNYILIKPTTNQMSKTDAKILTLILQKAKTFTEPAKQLGATNNYIDITAQISKKTYKATIYYLKTTPNTTQLNNKPPLFFIHGITARSAAYIPTLKILRKYFTIYALDLPFHGRSSIITPSVPNIEVFAEIISKTIHEIIKKEQILTQFQSIYIMGHSFGGALAFYSAQKLTKYNIPISRLYLLNPAGGVIKEHQAKLFYTTVIKRIVNIEKYYVLRKNFKRIIVEILINYIRAFEKRTTNSTFFNLLKIIPQGFQDFDKMHYKYPTTLIFSDDDNYFDSNYIITYCQKFNNLYFRMAYGMHDWLIIYPNQFEKILKPTFPHTQQTTTLHQTSKQNVRMRLLQIFKKLFNFKKT